jgi:NAD(P)-dependent dehydrogenase (short-subunit alcohol dehydrogenase family)
VFDIVKRGSELRPGVCAWYDRAMPDMTTRNALVTGGAHGIGAAVVQRLLAAGARVTVLDLELPGELEPREGLELVEGDVRRREDVRRAAQGVDAVVAVAGIGALTPLLEIDDATWQRMLDVNLTGVFLTVQEGARAMAATGKPGAIVVVSSTNAIYAEESTVPYTTTKGALVALVRAASLDLARHGIRINAVAPGMVRTRMAAALTEDADAAAEFLRNVPLERFAEPDEIASVVTFLLTEESSYVTGSLVVADGGLTVGMKLDVDTIGAGD